MFSKKGDDAVLAKLGSAPSPYNQIGQRLHEIIKESAPELEPVLRWGIPFYTRNGEDVCYIKSDKNFLVFGFGEEINPAYREGETMHPVVWSITELNSETEQEISRLIKKAVG